MRFAFLVGLLILSPLVLIAGIIVLAVGEDWGIALLVAGAYCLAWALVLWALRRRNLARDDE